MITYVLVHRHGDNYSSLHGAVKFVFHAIPPTTNPDVKSYISQLEKVLDEAKECDRIVMNGPTWLVALAGYVWLTNENRKRMQMAIFDQYTHKYIDFNPEFPCSVH